MRRPLLAVTIMSLATVLASTGCDVGSAENQQGLQAPEPPASKTTGTPCDPASEFLFITVDGGEIYNSHLPTELDFARADCPDQAAGGLAAYMLVTEYGAKLQVHGCTDPADESRAAVTLYGSLLATPGVGELPIGNWFHALIPFGGYSDLVTGGASVTLTEWGEPGEMIAGTLFAGGTSSNPYMRDFTFHGEFRVCRGPDSSTQLDP